LRAIEAGVIQREIQESAFRAQRAIDTGETPVVGVTRFQTGDDATIPIFSIDPEVEPSQQERLATVRARREMAAWRDSLDAVRSAARGNANLLPPIIAAVRARATVGEISDTLRDVFGEHRELTV
jgi:methylmalonyl-CoA mutase N-terminal domain/subunit